VTSGRALTRSDALPLATLAAALLLAGACGGAVTSSPAEHAAPPTDADPPAYAPAPSDAPTTGAPVGIVIRGRDDDARRVVLRFLEALRDRDTPGLEAVLADPIARAGGVIARPTLIAGLLRAADTLGLARGSELSALFDVPHALVEPLAARRDARRTSTRYRDDDRLVTFPARGAQSGRRLSELAFVRISVGELVVRLTPEPRIVGL
jgi:hypothetical protein